MLHTFHGNQPIEYLAHRLGVNKCNLFTSERVPEQRYIGVSLFQLPMFFHRLNSGRC